MGADIPKQKTVPKPAPWNEPALNAIATAPTKVFTRQSLTTILRDNQDGRRIPKHVSLNTFIAVLERRGELRLVQLPPVSDDSVYRPFMRYVWGSPSAFAVALSLRPRSYLSHVSAMVLNHLCGETQNRIYVNQEQSPKPAAGQHILQPSIDRAFQNRARISNYVFAYGGMELVLLNGKNTGNFGVAELTDPLGGSYTATNSERTLVDITVRPSYAGGVDMVLDAFRRARAQRSDSLLVEGLVKTLRVLSHAYPYHQAIGFYLRRVGISSTTTMPLREIGLDYDFYLQNEMSDPTFDSEWRIYYPKELDQ